MPRSESGISKVLAVLAVALPLQRAAADTLRVPRDYPTIQAAVNAASEGDQVLVADGVYTGTGNRDITFGGKLITLRSEHGPLACIIDCQGGYQSAHRGLIFSGGETPAAMVSGFTIRRGYAYGGGGIRCEGSSPTIANCIVTGNQALGVQPHCGPGFGGGIYSAGGSPTIINCQIVKNVATFPSHPTGRGGGMYCQGGSLTITNCLVAGNGAGGVAGCGSYGGGLYLSAGSAALVNSTFSGNWSYGSGGAIYSSGGSLTLVNCTLNGNGGGILNSAGTLSLANCVLWGNGTSQVTGAATVSHSDIQGGWSGPGSNNVAADPLFVDPLGADGLVGTRDDNLRLKPGSPCIDAGNASAVPRKIATDADGSARFVDDQATPDCPQAPGDCGPPPIVDMGSYEYYLPCPWDLDYSGQVGQEDLFALLESWGSPGGPPDFDGDGTVGILDFLKLLASWGPCCQPGDDASQDCNGNGFPDGCDLAAGQSADCNGNGLPDECDLADRMSTDCDGSTVPDECESSDCNGNGIADPCDVAQGTSLDCNLDFVPDECQGCGGCTTEADMLTVPDLGGADLFGGSVSASGGVALIGSSGNDIKYPNSGSAYVFRYDGAQWVQETTLTPSDAAMNDYFGGSVSLSGDVALVGAMWNDLQTADQGSAYVFRHDGTQWIEEATLTASDAAAGDEFGASVAVSGGIAVVGATGDDDGGSDSGSAYAFRHDGTRWVQETKLIATDAAAGDEFGASVSVSGSVAVVGASFDDDVAPSSGSAYVFRRQGTQWVQEAKLTASDAAYDSRFGMSVAASGDVVVVGARGAIINGPLSGAAYVYFFNGRTWVEQARLIAPNASHHDQFGTSVALGGGVAVVGAILADSAYVFGGICDCNRNGTLDLCEGE